MIWRRMRELHLEWWGETVEETDRKNREANEAAGHTIWPCAGGCGANVTSDGAFCLRCAIDNDR